MFHRDIIVIDDNTSARQIISETLADAGLDAVFVDNTADASKIFQQKDVSLVLLRGCGSEIDAAEFCSSVRRQKSDSETCIIAILKEAELSQAGSLLIAGASDLLVEPFEPRELRMRASIVPSDQINRVDSAHVVHVSEDACELIVPEFNPVTMRLDFGDRQAEIPAWEANPEVRRIALDQICVCPDCEAIPTYRNGCGACGSAFLEQKDLIHHYACAHVGPEQEFRSHGGGELSCPKCRMQNLVAGADFEITDGCLSCRDCNALLGEPSLIAHCTSCQNRFPAADVRTITVYGYQFGRAGAQARINAPYFRGLAVRSSDKWASSGLPGL